MVVAGTTSAEFQVEFKQDRSKSAMFFSSTPLPRRAPFAQATLSQPSAAARATRLPSVRREVHAQVRAALDGFESADDEARESSVDAICARLHEGGHILSAAELAILEQYQQQTHSYGGRSRVNHKADEVLRTPRPDRWDRTETPRSLGRSGSETERSNRGDRTARSIQSSVSTTSPPSTSRTSRTRISRSLSPSTSLWSSSGSLLETDAELMFPPSFHLAVSRLRTGGEKARQVSRIVAEAAVEDATRAVRQRMAAMDCPSPPPPPKTRHELAVLEALRKKQKTGVPLSADEQSILKAADKELERALKPAEPAGGSARRRRVTEHHLDRARRNALRALESVRLEVESKLIAQARAEDAELSKIKAEAKAVAAVAAELAERRTRIEAALAAEARAADEELSRIAAERARVEAKLIAEAKSADADIARVIAERLAAEAMLVAEAEAKAAAAARAKEMADAKLAAKEAAKAKKAKQARETARHSAKMRKLSKQGSGRG